MNRLRIAHRRRGLHRGAAVVEFAVLLPFITLVFLIGADWCRVYYAAETITDCARSGALAASGIAYLEYDLDDSERAAKGKAEAIKDGARLNPPLTTSGITVTTSGDYVTVTVDYDFNSTTNMMSFGNIWRLSRSVRMPILPSP
jgi:Flp pilus assembly protein TadG